MKENTTASLKGEVCLTLEHAIALRVGPVEGEAPLVVEEAVPPGHRHVLELVPVGRPDDGLRDHPRLLAGLHGGGVRRYLGCLCGIVHRYLELCVK